MGNQALDCRDDLPSVHPGAEEVCGDGLDNSCDGIACGDGPEGAGGSGETGASARFSSRRLALLR
ncbi:putative metal-binding motif-containing protein [Sorangium sp. So ce542]|uniref:putative metal-binding motif-containing protein n=1 Tax=Sorangium sp. So ce542 TaxID=3133316 RepID=UPI003F6084F2